jgi:hypothetical protein
MKKSLVAILLASAAAASYANPAQSGSASTAPGYASYRHVVLGYADDAAVAGSASNPAEPQSIEGPYARYLINNGFAKSEALAQAQRIGDQPRVALEATGTAQRPLTSYEAYQKVVLGQSIANTSKGTN